MRAGHPNGFEIEYRDFYFKDAGRSIRLALCPALSIPYSEEELDIICSKCPAHARHRTDLFCFPTSKREAYRLACEAISDIRTHEKAYHKAVEIMVKLQRGSG